MKLESECNHIFKKGDLYFCKLKTNKFYDNEEACDKKKDDICLINLIYKIKNDI